ncbi:prolyl oligopeptidase family serine peptidase [Chitinophaga lutea]
MNRLLLFLPCCLSLGVSAQQTPFQPDRTEILRRVSESGRLQRETPRTVLYTNVNAQWADDGRSFWYCNEGPEGKRAYLRADAATGVKRPAFDAARLASALQQATGAVSNPEKLYINRMRFAPDGQTFDLEADGNYWRCNLRDYTLQRADSIPPAKEHYFRKPPRRWENYSTDRQSPDGRYVVVYRGGNLLVADKQTRDTVAYTTDGSSAQPYGEQAWSPDGRTLVFYRTRPVEDAPVYYVLSSAGGTRGQLRSHPYKQPGDPFTTYEMFIAHPGKPGAVKVQTEPIDFFDAPRLHWNAGNTSFLYEKVDRGHQRFRIFSVDAQTAAVRTVLDEQSDTFIHEERIFTHYLPASNELIWSSEKDGWRHLYLADATTGQLKQQITKGEWVVRSVDSVDAVKREIWFRASGMQAGEDPYHMHFYRIGFSGKGLVSLTPEKGHHFVQFSPDRKHYIDSYSQIGTPHVTELRQTSNGKRVAILERADASAYFATGVAHPEVFTAKGRDGVTDIWGIVCRPSHMDSTRKYPIIEHIYAGPHDSYVPKSFTGNFRDMQYLAELGFIVVQIDGMGTANRSKAFHDVCWKNLADAGFPDRIRWIKAMAQKYRCADTSRVGIYGASAGGQNALGALLFYPEFYKAAVAANGCHDNRIDKQWWNEQWMGFPVGPHYEAQSNVTHAHLLKGKLLLIVGESDENVPPESTYRVADALIRAGKDYEFLALPGTGHSDGGSYGRRKRYHFFVRHLLGADVPFSDIQ